MTTIPISLPVPNKHKASPIRFTFAALLAGLFLLLAATPSARAQGTPPLCNGSGLGITLFTDANDAHIGDTLFYSTYVYNGIPGSGRTVCDASNITASVTTPDGVVHPFALVRTYLSQSQGDFYSNVVSYVVRAQDILPDGTVRATAEDHGKILQNDTPSDGGGNQGVNTEVSLPCILLISTCTGGVGENGTINFIGTVTNCGNNTLVNVAITNYVDGNAIPVAFITNLTKGQIANFSGSFTPTNTCGPTTQTLVGTGTDQFTAHPRQLFSTNFNTCSLTVTPSIVVTKSCPVSPVAPGQLLTFTGSVSNSGNVTLTNVIVVNNRPIANTPVISYATLAPGAISNFSGSYLAPTNCSVADTLTATASSKCGGLITNTATATCPIVTTPQILVTANCPVTPILPGGTFIYNGTVQNTGNNTLTNVLVVTGPTNTTVFTVATLAPGAISNFTSSSTVPANACSVTTTYTATGRDSCTLTSVTNSATAVCPVTTAPGIAVTLACPITPSVAGSSITYTGNVTNTGNVTLTNILVVINQPTPGSPVTGPFTLAPHTSSNFTATFTAPNTCTVSTTVNVTGNDNCSGLPVSGSNAATCSLSSTPLLIVTQNCPVSPVAPGGLFTYTGTVSNAGNIILTNIIVLNNQSGATPVFTAVSMSPGSVSNFTGSYLTPTNCSTTSTSTGTARSTCGVGVTNAVSTTCAITTTPVLTLTQNCPVTPTVPGALLTYTGTISNAGNITITNVVILNNVSGASPIFTAVSMAPGSISNYSGSYVTPTNCSTTSTSTVTGRSTCGAATTNTVSATCAITTAPSLVLTQNCPITTTTPGGVLTYTGTIRNSGNIPLTNVIILNDQSGATPIFTAVTMAPGAISNYSGSYIAPSTCSSTSTSTGTATSICGTAVTNAISTTCTITTVPSLLLTQSCPITPVAPGGLLIYTGTVSNSGNITLTNVVILNNLSGTNPVYTVTNLAPGAVSNYTGSYLAPTNCSVTSTSTGTGRSTCGIAVTNAVTSTCSITTTPQIAITATCPVTPITPGSSFVSSGTVQNTGNNTLTNVQVVSDRPVANTVIFTATTLAPGAIANFSSTITVPVNACSVTTTFSGTGRDSCSLTSVTNTTVTTCTVTTAPSIGVTLACPVTSATTGGLIVYTGNVTNSGNVTLNNVFVVNNQPTNNAPVMGPISLAPHSSSNFTASFLTPSNSCSVSSTVTATGGDSCTGNMVTNTASTTCPLATTPSLILTQNCPLTPSVPGGQLTYTGTVSNAGNITLTNVIVLNNQSGATPIFTAASLAPGAVSNYSGSYTAPAACATTSISTGTATSICGTAVTNTATTTCSISTAPLLILTQNCPITPAVPGGTLIYSGTVSNAGNIMLTNVVILNNQSGSTPIFTAASLAPGAVSNFSGSYIAPAACATTSTSTGTATSICGISVTNAASTTCPITTTPGLTLVQNCPVAPTVPGGTLTYTGTVQNTGNITLTNVIIVNNQSITNPIYTIATLAPGAISNYSGSYLAPTNCSTTSISTGTATSICGVPVTNVVTTTCTITTTPILILTQSCPITPVVPGGLLIYNGTISNAGNITITNVVIVNSQSGTNPIFTAVSMAPGSVSNYTGSYLAPTNCSVTSTSTGTGRSTCGIATTNTVSSTCTITTTPIITVSVLCPVTPIVPGGSTTYSGSVSNAGNITLTNVMVTTDRSGTNAPVAVVAILAPGATSPFIITYTLPANACTFSTVFTASGQNFCTGSTVSNVVTTTCTVTTAPSIGVSLTCPASPSITGGVITYSGIVTNTGNVMLNNVTVVDTQSGLVQIVTNLPAHSATNFFATFVAPTNSCSVSSTATVMGSDNCTGNMVTNSVTTTCSLVTTPALVLTQNCPVTPTVPGALMTYSGTISNAGNITLTNVSIVNNQSGASPIFTAGSMAPGAVSNYSGSYIAPTNCSTTSTSTGTGRSLCGASVTNTATTTCLITTAPAIQVIQTCPATNVLPGGLLTYTGTVRNVGNITLTNIIVTSDRPGSNTVIYTTASLAPGAVSNFSGSYQVPSNCCVVSSTVMGSGQGCNGTTVTDTDTRTCTVLTLPSIVVTKVCTSGTIHTGDMLTYTGFVSNSGNITLINVTVMNNQPSGGSTFFGPATLAPGEAFTYNAAYIAPVDFCGMDTVTASGMNVCTYQTVSNSVTSTCPVITAAPKIALTKNCPTTPTPRGGLYTYTGTVSNPGTVTLVNVYVTDNEPSNNTPVIGPITIAPGATVTFTNSYIAPRCCCLIFDTLTARGQDRCYGSNVTTTASSVCPVLSTPSISINRVCPVTGPVGSTYTYTGTITNTGDVVLTNVFVYSSAPNDNTLLLGPTELAPGESAPFSGSYTVTTNNPANDTVTALGTDTCQGRTVSTTANCAGPVGQVTPPKILSLTVSNHFATVIWTAVPGTLYNLQSQPTLSNQWMNVPGPVIATTNTAMKLDPTPVTDTNRFYRVKVGP